MKIAIGCDQNAYDLKLVIRKDLEELSIEYDDFGSHAGEQVLYPNIAHQIAVEVSKGHYQRAIILCGTGIGMAITANKVPGVRAAVCHDVYSAERSRKSNNAQIMTMGAEVIGPALAKKMVDVWLASEFQGGGSAQKVERICEIDESYRK